jgi:23S rRNA (adenine2030-N6)-methyltransferase
VASEAQTLNYKHAYHAGNAVDVIKHLAWVGIVEALQHQHAQLTIIDAHGGSGLYTLDPHGEARDGILALTATQTATLGTYGKLIAPYMVQTPPLYPGSPLLVAHMLRPKDTLYIRDVQVEEIAALKANLSRFRAQTHIEIGNGYSLAARTHKGPRLVLLDPPFEDDAEWDHLIRTTAAALKSRETVVAIWTPIKDYSEWDADITDLTHAVGRAGNVQVHPFLIQPPTNPMRLNGCAIVLVTPSERDTFPSQVWNKACMATCTTLSARISV